MKSSKIIINVDTGIDDALALLLADKVFGKQIIGVTTSAGNVLLDYVNYNTLCITELMNNQVDVYSGATKATNGKPYTYAYDYHGKNGICDVELETTKKISGISAVDFIIDSINKYKGEVTLISLGPLTNIALAYKKSSDIAKSLQKLIIMGGAVNVEGNETKFAEFNFYQDPEAVKLVLDNFKDIYLVPLDVTNNCFVEIKDLEQIKDGSFIKKAVSNWYKNFGDWRKRKFELYDPLAILAVEGNFLKYKSENLFIEISGDKRGSVIKGGTNKISWAYQVESKKFVKQFIKNIGVNYALKHIEE